MAERIILAVVVTHYPLYIHNQLSLTHTLSLNSSSLLLIILGCFVDTLNKSTEQE